MRTVVYRFESTSSGGGTSSLSITPPTLVWAKYLDDSEIDYTAGDLDLFTTNAPIAPPPAHLAYVDGRLDNPDGFGSHDVLAGILDLNLSSCITIDVDHTLQE